METTEPISGFHESSHEVGDLLPDLVDLFYRVGPGRVNMGALAGIRRAGSNTAG